MAVDWQPTASIETIRQRSTLVAGIRDFFALQKVMEVEVPVLGDFGVTDIHIDSLQVNSQQFLSGGQVKYLQSSPEYFMKRLLAAGSGDIYYMGKAFRAGEAGQRHNPEFTLLEWYRVGWTEQQLMAEVAELVQSLSEVSMVVTQLSYRQLFQQATALDPHDAPLTVLQQRAAEISSRDFSTESRSVCLDLIFSLQVEPQLPEGLVFVKDYPSCQSALAQLGVDERGVVIARRFEAFLNGMELANGYYELTDAVEQRSRFESDQALRKAASKPAIDMDENLLSAMEAGLPSCAGVALGVDRLAMQLLGAKEIRQTVSFV